MFYLKQSLSYEVFIRVFLTFRITTSRNRHYFLSRVEWSCYAIYNINMFITLEAFIFFRITKRLLSYRTFFFCFFLSVNKIWSKNCSYDWKCTVLISLDHITWNINLTTIVLFYGGRIFVTKGPKFVCNILR